MPIAGQIWKPIDIGLERGAVRSGSKAAWAVRERQSDAHWRAEPDRWQNFSWSRALIADLVLG